VKIACVQVTSRDDKAANLETAERLVAGAAAGGAELIVLPEKWNAIGSAETLHAAAEPLEGGESVEAMSAWARRYGITLVGGSITERREGREKLSNTCLVFGPEGDLVATYRKIHMFDVEVNGHVYKESEHEAPGDEIVVTETAAGVPLGMTICYDVRFPELYRILAVRGAQIVTVPAAFTFATTRDHWEVLLRARAIEGQAFVVAANQVGEHAPGIRSGGRSMIVDPWGIVLAQAPDAPGHIVAELDLARLAQIREQLPSLANRRADAYRWPAELHV